MNYDTDLLTEEEGIHDDLTVLDKAFVADLIDKIMQFMTAFVGFELHPYQKPFARRIIESVVIGDAEELTAVACRQCLDGDTVVFRRDGSAVRLRNHENAWSTGVKPTKRYKIKGGAEIIATDNHPVMTNNGWVPAGLLKVGDRVATLLNWNTWADSHPEITTDQARFMGYMVTDGSCDINNTQSPKFTNIRPEYLQEVSDLALNIFGITSKWYSKGKGYDLLFTGARTNKRNPVKAFYDTLGMDHGFPTQVFDWNLELVSEFINRAWSGDGCVRVNRNNSDVFMACGNDEIYARYWQSLLWKIGVSSTVKREILAKGTGTFHRLVVGTGSNNIRRFFEVVGPIYGKEDGSKLAVDCCRPHIPTPVFEEYPCPGVSKHLFRGADLCIRCGSSKNRRVNGIGIHAKRSIAKPIDITGEDGEQFTFERIVAIDDAGDREVFDVEYPDKGWFIAQGAYVHNSGKSEVIADVVSTLMVLLPKLAVMYPSLLDKFASGIMVGVFAPVEGQVETLFGRIVDRLTSDHAMSFLTDPEIDDKPTKPSGVTKTIRLRNSGSFVSMMTANPRAKIESKSFHLIIIDEAQESDDFVVEKSIDPMRTYYAGTMIKTGTPTITKNNFYRSMQLNKRRQTIRKSKNNHFEWDYKEVIKWVPNYKKTIAKAILRMGEDSPEFLMSYCCKWLLDKGMFVTDAKMLELGDTSMEIVKSWHKTPVVVGIDPARKTDSTVVTVVYVDWDRPDEFGYYPHRILNWLELTGDSWEEQYYKIVAFLSNYDVLLVGVDANGVGDSVQERLGLLLPRSEIVPLSSSVQEQTRRWKHLQALMERSDAKRGPRLMWPAHAHTRRLKTWTRFNQQMTDAEMNFKGPNIKVEAPDEAHAHDDYVDSLAIACAMTLDVTVPTIEVSENSFYSRSR